MSHDSPYTIILNNNNNIIIINHYYISKLKQNQDGDNFSQLKKCTNTINILGSRDNNNNNNNIHLIKDIYTFVQEQKKPTNITDNKRKHVF